MPHHQRQMSRHLVQEVIRRDYGPHEQFLTSLIKHPCQPRTYLCSSSNISSEEFDASFELLKEFQVINSLNVPIIRQQRLTNRRVTVFYCFQKELLNSSLKAQLVSTLPEPYRRVVRQIVIRGTLSSAELRQIVSSSVSTRQQALGNDFNKTINALLVNKIITTKFDIDKRQKMHILQNYLQLNGMGNLAGANQTSVILKRSNANNIIDRLPVDLRRLIGGENSQNDDGDENNVNTDDAYVIDFAGVVNFLKWYGVVQRVERICGGIPSKLLALLLTASNGGISVVFDVQQLRDWAVALGDAVLCSPGGILAQNGGFWGVNGTNSGDNISDIQLQQILQDLITACILDAPNSLGRYGLDVERAFSQLKREVALGVVKSRHGVEAGRVLGFLMQTGRSTLQGVEEKCLLSTERCFQILNKLQKDGLVQSYLRGKQEWGERSDRLAALYGAPEGEVFSQIKTLVSGVAAALLGIVQQCGNGTRGVAAGAQAVAALGGVMDALAAVI